MVRHIVMWKVKDSKNKSEDIQKLKLELERLPAKIEVIIDFEVGLDFSKKGEVSADIILNSTFETADDLEVYQKHPEHQKAVDIIRSLTMERRVVDYIF